MRTLAILVAIAALAAVPCAWDTPPGEAPPIAALFGSNAATRAMPANFVPKPAQDSGAPESESMGEGNYEAL